MGVADLLAGLRPRPTINEQACSRRLGSGCTVCVDVCPKQALQITSSGGRDHHAPAVDPLLCVGCGLCEAQCPVQAISRVAHSPQLLVEAARGKQRLRFRCEAARTSGAPLDADEDTAAGLDVGCLASLHPETVAAAAGELHEDGAVELLRGDCDRCPMGAGKAVASMVSEAAACLAGAGRIDVCVVPEDDRAAEATRRPTRRMSRRSLFRSASPKKMAEDAVAATTSSAGGPSPRALLLRALEGPALPRPLAEQGCTGCRACVNVCPQHALSCTDTADVFELTVDPTACVGCGECVRVCPEDVLHARGRVTDATPVVLARVTLERCGSCGMPLSPGELRRCALCSSHESLTSDVWSQYSL